MDNIEPKKLESIPKELAPITVTLGIFEGGPTFNAIHQFHKKFQVFEWDEGIDPRAKAISIVAEGKTVMAPDIPSAVAEWITMYGQVKPVST